jgi:hypothetical protein
MRISEMFGTITTGTLYPRTRGGEVRTTRFCNRAAASRVIGTSSLCALVISTLFGPMGSAASDSGSEIVRVKNALSAALSTETKADYPAFYAFLSARAKAKLRREDGVRTAEDYRKLRIKSEAKWLKNDLLSVRAVNGHKYSALSRAEVAETGETERFCVRYMLVFEGAWKIDQWQYLDSCPSSK